MQKNSTKNTARPGGKRFLIDALRAKGFTYRMAVKIINAILDSWKDHLAAWDYVEVPGGTMYLKMYRGKPRVEVLHKFRNVNTHELNLRRVYYPGERSMVVFEADPDFEFRVNQQPELPPSCEPRALPQAEPPPQPEPPEMSECRQLVSEILAGKADQVIMDRLLDTVDRNPRELYERYPVPSKPRALLLRLREIKRRGYHFGFCIDGLDVLAYHVRDLCWMK